jgi:cell wall-associated NlpC family hydrolase
MMGMRAGAVRRGWLLAGAVLLLSLGGGCGRPAVVTKASPARVPEKIVAAPRLGYTIQAGAFAVAENAARLTRLLQEQGLDATYFVAKQGLYKVRFGNFPTREAARARAEEVRAAGIIGEFYIVSPDQYAVASREERGEAYLREELVRTAQSFLGVPYLWGGASADTGFDCSGLTMTVYQLNGLDIPRTSGAQFSAGTPVDRGALEKGDLIFFAKEGNAVSHVGVYAGGGQFIHSPGKGKRIRKDSLASGYYSRTFLGARSYL